MNAVIRYPFGLLLGGLIAFNAGGHTYDLTLGADAAATDYFGVICSTESGADTDHLFIQTRSTTPNGPLVNALLHKGTFAAAATDPVSGDADPGPPIRVHGGNGLYHLLISKTGFGAVSYTLTAHCLDASGTQHTGTDGVVYQYQYQYR